MANATITGTASNFGSISGVLAGEAGTVAGTITGTVSGTLTGSVGVPGAGVPSGGTTGQVLKKVSNTDYDTTWGTDLASAAWGTITGTITDQTDLTAYVAAQLAGGTAVAKNLEVYVRNQSGATLTAGTIVYIDGATGNRPTVTKAQANNDANSAQTFGFIKENIANNGFGYVIVRGELENVDTSALTEGQQLYLSPTTAGTWTTTKPSAPQHLVYVGICIRAHPTQGIILVAIQNGYELNELHDVKITSVSNGQVLKYDSAQGLWVNGTDSSGVAWGGITGTLSNQTDLQTALDAKANLSGATFTGDVGITSSTTKKLTITNTTVGPNQLSDLSSSLLRIGYTGISNSYTYISNDQVFTGSSGTGTINIETSNTGGFQPHIIVQNTLGTGTKITDGQFLRDTGTGFFEPYASLAGATFTGKISATSVGGLAGVNIGIGGTSGSATTPGDLWITTGGANLNFRDATGAWKVLASLQNGNVFTAVQAVDVSSASTALRVTQRGAGEAFRVEDSTTPDATAFVINADGKVGIGVAPDASAALKIDANGIKFNDGTTQTTAPVAAPNYVNVQVFGGPSSSGSFTWTKPAGAKTVEVMMMSGGGGGGSGARQATSVGRFGGGGGGGAGAILYKIDADSLASTETVTVGAGGAGGAAVTSDSTNGNAGTKGGDSVFGPITCRGGNGGGGGTDTTGAAGATSLWYQWLGEVKTVNNRGGVAPAAGANLIYELFYCATGGGGGASRAATITSPSAGGAGGNKLAAAAGGVESGLTTTVNGGAGGIGGTSTPAVAGSNGTEYWGGTGGGGGYYRPSTAGSSGAAGGWPGGGGGGGGCSDNGNNSGAGGSGANGVVVVITYCT